MLLITGAADSSPCWVIWIKSWSKVLHPYAEPCPFKPLRAAWRAGVTTSPSVHFVGILLMIHIRGGQKIHHDFNSLTSGFSNRPCSMFSTFYERMIQHLSLRLVILLSPHVTCWSSFSVSQQKYSDASSHVVKKIYFLHLLASLFIFCHYLKYFTDTEKIIFWVMPA